MTQAGTSFYSRQTYFPFGAQRTTEGSALPTDYTFTGQKNDDSTGLMFYGARYYDTTLGRFTQADTIVPSPLNPQGLNRFAYTLNNPVRYIDPSGHAETDPTEGTGGGNGVEGDDPLENQEEVVQLNEDGEVEVLPAETGEDQGAKDKDAKAGKCDVASADSGFGSDCGNKEEQQQEAVCNKECNYKNWQSYLENAKNLDMAVGGIIAGAGLWSCIETGGLGCAVAALGGAMAFYGQAVPGVDAGLLSKCLNSPLCVDRAPAITESPGLDPVLPILHEYPALAPSPTNFQESANPVERFLPWNFLPVGSAIQKILGEK